MQIPFFEAIADAGTVLIAGAGGGFDIVSGIPLYLYLRRLGKQVILANLSFSELAFTDSEEICPGAFLVTAQSREVPYFPEKMIVEWLQARNEAPVMAGFSNKLGVQPLRHAYQTLIDRYQVDALVLVDGGTDSLMFGDEAGVATIVEDACSMLAASLTTVRNSYLLAIGFGVDFFHDLNHHSCLENIATMIKDGQYLGAQALTNDSAEGQGFLELVAYLNQRMAFHESIVTNSIASAMQGEFGDHQVSRRTQGSALFINPLMSLGWYFRLGGLVARMQFADKIEASQTMKEVAQAVTVFRAIVTRRPNLPIPL